MDRRRRDSGKLHVIRKGVPAKWEKTMMPNEGVVTAPWRAKTPGGSIIAAMRRGAE
jgi:hypothetical protein